MKLDGKYGAGILFVLFLVAAYFPLFLHLDMLSLWVYDEARLAVNALEMANGGNPLVTTFNGSPDMWNTKPPFMIWMQVICMKMFGYNELAVRLPAALSALFTVLFLFWFSARKLGVHC